jgi:anaerobic dimethyl sulfoxide reductase subunit A
MPSDKSESNSEERKMGRRSFITALAAVGGVAVGAAGAEILNLAPRTTPTVPPPAVTKSAGSEVRARVSAIVDQQVANHLGEIYYYANCQMNCGGNNACVLKVRSKNGVLTSIEPDDTIHPNADREDEVMTDDDLSKMYLQQRPCVRGYSWKEEVYAPDRIRYPMKRVGPRGSGLWQRISWDEAISTVAGNIKQAMDKYGPLSFTFGKTSSCPPITYFGAGVNNWGAGQCTFGMAWFARRFMCASGINEPYSRGLTPMTAGPGNPWLGVYAHFGNNPADIFKVKMIVLWGVNPAITSQFIAPWYLVMARERGIPIVCIDPRYTKTAEVLSDQWIPIRATTDAVMEMAMCYTLFSEDSYDKKFVSEQVEPVGFAKWKDYIMGATDGTPKTPQWAEKICGVPAETIVDLTHKILANKPCEFMWFLAPGRQPWGEIQCRIQILLQAMLGTIVTSKTQPGTVTAAPPSYAKGPAAYKTPTAESCTKWGDSILLRPKLDAGKISVEEYKRAIGCAQNLPAPNYKVMVKTGGNSLNTIPNTNKNIEATRMLDFVAVPGWHLDQQTARYCDVVLPVATALEEDPTILATTNSSLLLTGPTIALPGEVKSQNWIWTQLSYALGVGDNYNAAYKPGDDWDSAVNAATAAAVAKTTKANKISKSYVDWKASGVLRVTPDSDALKEQTIGIAQGPAFVIAPKWTTASGKIEPYSNDIANVGNFRTTCWGYGVDPPYDIPPLPTWSPPWETFWDPKVAKYPLVQLSSHARYRAHTAFDNNALLADCYRHAVWISVADAKSRGIRDNDFVRVYNDTGEMILPAYVTSRITPGIVEVHHGAWFPATSAASTLNAAGVDTRGNDNILTSARDNVSDAVPVTSIVQVEKA